ncbi:WASH complex subunit 4 [Drosophila ficusphila]|uniref:WASH complex subunit 4 n=1 Tax=Drosophila ficusphila TaxID=30025 RepID=UPI0007E67A1E|nr:WASH complex subunit 4 [Drosophila ficusphila]
MREEQGSISMFAEDILKDYGSFIADHDEKLKSLRNKVPNSDVMEPSSWINIGTVIEVNFVNNDYIISDHIFEESELVANKPLTTLANLCNQCKKLSRKAKRIQLAFMFSDFRLDDSPHAQTSEGLEGSLVRMSSAMDFICQVYFLLKRIIVILQNLWRQIAASVDVPADISEVHIFAVFNVITELLEHVVIFNELANQSKITAMWALYKKWLINLSNNGGLSSDRLTSLELNGLNTSLVDIESVITKDFFRILLDSLMELKKQFSLNVVNHITQHSNAYLRKLHLEIDANQSNEFKNYEEPKHIIHLTAFVAVVHEFGIQMEGKLVRNIADLVAKHKQVPLNRSVLWSPSAFLAQHAKTLVKSPSRPLDNNGLKIHSTVLEKFKLSDQKTCRHLGTQISLWSIKMQRVFDAGVFGHLKTFSQLILSGHSFADQVTLLAVALINRHAALGTPLSKHDWFLVSRLLQYLKVLQKTFESNQINFVRFINSLIQWQKQKVLHLLHTTKKKIVDLKLLQRKMNFLSTMKLAEKSIMGFPSKQRLTFMNLALGEFLDNRLLPADNQKLIKSILLRANNISNFMRDIRGQLDSSDSSCLVYNYWFLNTAVLKEYTELQRNPYSLQNIVSVSHHLDKIIAIFKGSECLKRSANDLIIEFLSNQLEFFLRVEALSHLFQNQDQPFQQSALDYRLCINAAPIENSGDYNIIKDHLENYFTATFYNLTTIAPHDWKSYEKMRHLASKVLHLRPIDDHLPNQIIDQGIDVLQIMRNIHTFASSYAYNMNLQLFVETHSKGKHLDIIGTRHVANSVQTHGTGIINTTVNFIYQFLRQKFYTFSTFLHDEQIKSRLLKELRFHSEHKLSKLYHSYPYERADSFLKKIRKLGCSSSGETYMDLFRKVITQVGNAVGYVRLLQAGSKNANFRSRSFKTRFDSNFSSNGSKMHEVTESSIKEYEKSLGHMKECYSDSTNYFKLLLQGFQPFLCNPHNHHLRTFYLITPALIMNYIDYRVKQKLKIHKKDQTKISLFEDGFAIGLVYILNMLNQQTEFHELGWSQTTTRHLNEERAKVRDIIKSQQSATDQLDEKLCQTVAITERHVNAYEHEYNLLYATLSSSEIFFQ